MPSKSIKMYLQPIIMSVENLQDAISKIALNDDQASFEKIYKSYYSRLYKLAFSIVKSEESAEEIYDDVMMELWLNRENLMKINNLTVYIYVAVKNRSLRYLSRANKISQVNLDDVSIEIQDLNPTAYEQLISAEFLTEINKAIDQLTPQCRAVFKLIKEDGLKYREVAEILDMSIKNVEYHIANALRKISRSINATKRTFIKGSFMSINSN